jgi:hypothetical protein
LTSRPILYNMTIFICWFLFYLTMLFQRQNLYSIEWVSKMNTEWVRIWKNVPYYIIV